MLLKDLMKNQAIEDVEYESKTIIDQFVDDPDPNR